MKSLLNNYWRSALPKLIAVGCSNTRGDGLDNIKLAWPQLLADKMGYECVNTGRGGASNREIWWNILNHNYNPGDIVVALWTFTFRDCIVSQTAQPKQLGSWHKNPVIKKFMVDTFDEFDKRVESHTYIQHANLVVKDKVNVYNFACEEVQLIPYPNWQTIPIIGNLQPIYESGDRGNDNIHPGPECHKQFSDFMYDKITKVNIGEIPNFYPTGIHRISVKHYLENETFVHK